MHGTAVDHIKYYIPTDGRVDAVKFYHDGLGFAIEGMAAYESDEKPFFSVRISPGSVLHLEPDPKFSKPDRTAADHVAIRVAESIDVIETMLTDADIDIDRRLTPRGATGVAPAVYVTDPFGYRVEIKSEQQSN
ncbi:VOC family protein [Haloquadratum walsbyi]|uniref:Glyoxalase domain protein n=1 Tax=Haloquadratum walsbyi (strain DSM 16854 / JCM 12705 / C23) TaxID=768065 RepID=G0LMP1_HALWC|nr:VOC family protein [Haloquadratum walsbyi]CCC41361.1 glyoxalase domain protein [Haloquadratum walsbyi C23]